MKKALLKRFKITKTGKMLHRRPGQNHFNAKESRKKQLRQKACVSLSSSTLERKVREQLYQ